MAKATLPTNFKDDVMNASMQNERRYRVIYNSDGTISLEDATTYDQVGSDFGQAQINATNDAVNQSVDKAVVIDDLDDIAANTTPGKVAGALAVAELNRNSIIESGSNDNGYYRKYANGTLEMWAQKALSGISITSKNGNMYISAQQMIAFPETSLTDFFDIGITFVSNTGAFATASTGGNRKNNAGFWLFSSAAAVDVSGGVYAHAIGTWK